MPHTDREIELLYLEATAADMLAEYYTHDTRYSFSYAKKAEEAWYYYYAARTALEDAEFLNPQGETTNE